MPRCLPACWGLQGEASSLSVPRRWSVYVALPRSRRGQRSARSFSTKSVARVNCMPSRAQSLPGSWMKARRRCASITGRRDNDRSVGLTLIECDRVILEQRHSVN